MALINLEKNAQGEIKADPGFVGRIMNRASALYNKGSATAENLLNEAGLYWNALKKGVGEVQQEVGTRAGQVVGEALSSTHIPLRGIIGILGKHQNQIIKNLKDIHRNAQDISQNRGNIEKVQQAVDKAHKKINELGEQVHANKEDIEKATIGFDRALAETNDPEAALDRVIAGLFLKAERGWSNLKRRIGQEYEYLTGQLSRIPKPYLYGGAGAVGLLAAALLMRKLMAKEKEEED